MAPLLSIITVTYNAAHDIAFTLKSVEEQTFKDYEYIVIDGKSSDNTLELVAQTRVERLTIVSESDKGIYDAMNKGLSKASGTYVLFLNAGDSFSDCKVLEKFRNAVVRHPEADVVYGQTDLVNNKREKIGPRHLQAPPVLTMESFSNGMLVCHQAFFARRSITSPYDLQYRFSADFDWCIKILSRSKSNIYLGPESIIDYLYEGITTRNHKKSLMERYRIMKHYYGTIPTILRHIKFFFRQLKRKFK